LVFEHSKTEIIFNKLSRISINYK